MKALLLIAHGSRRESSNDEIRALAVQLRDNPRFDLVECAFLEMTGPTILQCGGKLAAAGATEIVVLPYFLAAGNHVATDIPVEVALIKQRHQSLKITIAPHLGAATGIGQLIHHHLQPLASPE